jgi:hypothetical protein
LVRDLGPVDHHGQLQWSDPSEVSLGLAATIFQEPSLFATGHAVEPSVFHGHLLHASAYGLISNRLFRSDAFENLSLALILSALIEKLDQQR